MKLYVKNSDGKYAEATFEIREYYSNGWSIDYANDLEENVREFSRMTVNQYFNLVDYWASEDCEADGYDMTNLTVIYDEIDELDFCLTAKDIIDYFEDMTERFGGRYL